ncbi:DNA cytosine methyltransferase [Aquimarina sp. 2201CG14-23]|uniref:DNA cytosine methyltransferase n=1 Tax=Aquimarina mycalae TaxID=3040073 RepID=UPI0024782B47|nr:DNA cytosine methyltransferase [Aquimarina sp. 2201CG14-23]MDH7444945.1 DNA cytosine methyltransferase [Aquimarina sp. 2201CG14-23]
MIKGRIKVEDIDGQLFEVKVVEPDNPKPASFTHYLHNHKNGVSQFYKKDALAFVKEILAKEYPTNEITNKIAEETLQHLIYDLHKTIPFPAPENPKFKFIDLFAGIGGFRMAFQNLEGKCVFTSEWDKYSKQTYKANFGEIPFGDITKSETKSYIPDNFDVLCAGFPCQAFSIAGRRGGFEDTRGTLFFDVAEIIKKKQPKAIFLENVKGLRNHDKGKTLATILNVLREDLNYYVPEPQILNAKEFGVPQNRERIFIVGFRKDLGITDFQYPEPTNKDVALEDILEKEEVSVKYYLSTTYVQTLKNHRARHESKGNGFGYEIIPNDGTANAVVCGGMGRERNLVLDDRLTNFKPITNISGEVNREGIRKMTPREWARLQGFPDDFKIIVSDAQAYKQFGNSVAVPAIQATAQEIIKKLNL